MIDMIEVARDLEKDPVDMLYIPLPNGDLYNGEVVEVSAFTNLRKNAAGNVLAEASLYVTSEGEIIVTVFVTPFDSKDAKSYYERTWWTPFLHDAVNWSARIGEAMLALSNPLSLVHTEFLFADALFGVWRTALPLLRKHVHDEDMTSLVIAEAYLQHASAYWDADVEV